MLMPHLAIGPTGFDKAQMQPTAALAARTAAGGCLLEAITCNTGRLTYA
jgi:hypothetical protein